MKARKGLLWLVGVVAVTLLSVGVVMALGVGNVDGVWDAIEDGSGASCDGWASMTGSEFPWSTTDPSIQSSGGFLADENQVRYGFPSGYTVCPDTRTGFLAQSGFGFDGVNGVVGVSLDEPFYLGTFTHYNNPLESAPDLLEWVDLALTVPIDCDDDGDTDTTFTINPRFYLEETINNADPCPYLEGPNENGCADQVLIEQPEMPTFICDNVDYTVNVYGFLQNADCETVFDENQVSTRFLTREQSPNPACLWAEIDLPPADAAVSKECIQSTGGDLYYRIVVVNNGPGTALGAHLEDTLPDGVTYASYVSMRTVGGVATPMGTCTADGQAVSCDLNAVLPELADDPTARWAVDIMVEDVGGDYVNTVSLTTTSVDEVLTNNQASATCSPTSVTLVSFTARSSQAPRLPQWLRALLSFWGH